ncbi:copia protein [Tanacetum coccineum]|uniref:Copia protein n=1 Tax=Tanacetum coccineum TaxID=301880 RepID=A0ABQ5FXY7_9ASTR
MTEFPQLDLGLVVPVFTQGADPFPCLNKAMVFLSALAASRFPSTNDQLRTSSNPRNQATIQDGRVIVQQVQGRQGQSYVGTSYKGNATNSRRNKEGGHARVVKCYNCQGEGHMARQYEEKLVFLGDPGIPEAVILEVPHSESYHNDLDNQSMHAMEDFEQTPIVDFLDNELTVIAYIIHFLNLCKNTHKVAVQELLILMTQDSMILSVIEQMSEQND